MLEICGAFILVLSMGISGHTMLKLSKQDKKFIEWVNK